ncbi:VWA domain-containing protein [Rhodoferax sp. GW822-FHT02A01]|uniref:VWA domain-containing protein n=1 Tax=Rhodoferax sp. GW822-FHT02A01 TaxID=3141537 RepID=UPI00315CD671
MTQTLPVPVLFAVGEGRLAGLDALARTLWRPALTQVHGTLEDRLQGLVQLRGILVDATHKDEPHDALLGAPWPPEPIARPLARVLRQLELQRFCSAQPELADTVLRSLLFHLDFVTHFEDRGTTRAEAIAMAVSAFADEWTERSGEMDEVVQVFGMLPQDCKSSRWDRLLGILKSTGWQEVLRSHRLLVALPELTRLLQDLGRSRPVAESPSRPQSWVEAMKEVVALQDLQSTVRVPDLPGQTQGIHRGDQIARMVPSESMLLGHPRLRLLWHARRAERTLLCYEDDDQMAGVRRHKAQVRQPHQGQLPAPEFIAGPVLVCVDTSGSMQGGAEAVAKAVVLEAMRAAHAHGRRCHVFVFGGNDETIEMELPLDSAGLEHLTDFLGQSFQGGTDISGPLERVISKLEDTAWQQADLLIATDGEFGVTPAVAARLDAVKRKLGLRVQGVLIGDRETLGLIEVCDHIFPVRNWRKFGGLNVESPVHTSSLTALYFPAAVRRTGV